jgi:hypothetical protein
MSKIRMEEMMEGWKDGRMEGWEADGEARMSPVEWIGREGCSG